MADVAELIREARKQKGMSQDDLAARMGVGQQAVSKWEAGTSTPRIARLAQLEKILDIPPGKLIVAAGYLSAIPAEGLDWVIVSETAEPDEGLPAASAVVTFRNQLSALHGKIDTLDEDDRKIVEDLVDRLLSE